MKVSCSIETHCLTGLCRHQSTTLVRRHAIYYSSASGIVIPPMAFCSLRSLYLVLGGLYSHRNCKNVRLTAHRKVLGICIGMVWNSNLGKMVILSRLHLPNREKVLAL